MEVRDICYSGCVVASPSLTLQTQLGNFKQRVKAISLPELGRRIAVERRKTCSPQSTAFITLTVQRSVLGITLRCDINSE